MSESEEVESLPVKSGRVKWFNNRQGYGFITVTGENDEHNGEDIFVHHSALQCDADQYRYLLLGEYVTFELEKAENSNHTWKASNVRGVSGGKLMCESQRQGNGQTRRPRAGGRGPREQSHVLPSHVPGHDWVLMKPRRQPRDSTQQPQESSE